MKNLKLKIKKYHLQYHQKHEVIRDKFDKRCAGFFHSKTGIKGKTYPIHALEDSVLLRHLPKLVCRFSVILALDTPTVKESESFCRQMTWWRLGHWLHRLAELVSWSWSPERYPGAAGRVKGWGRGQEVQLNWEGLQGAVRKGPNGRQISPRSLIVLMSGW